MLKRVLEKARELLTPYIVLLLYTFLLSIDLGNGCRLVGGNTTAFVYSLMINDPYYVKLLSLSLVYSFAKKRLYGHYRFEVKRIAFLIKSIKAGFFLSIFSCLASMIGVIPCVTIGDNWGTAIDAIGTYAGGRMHYWRISYDIISTLSPVLAIVEATCIVIVYTIFVSFLVERCFTSNFFLIITIMMCFSDFQVINELATMYEYVFPPSVVRISLSSQGNFIYALLYLSLLTVILLLLYGKRRK